jgi:hypothetical protein
MSKSKKEEFKFDKFIKSIVKREGTLQRHTEDREEDYEDSPQRKYDKLYRERWQNRVRYNHAPKRGK